MLSHEAEKIEANVFVEVGKWEMLWSPGWRSPPSRSTFDRQELKWGPTCLPLPPPASLCCSLVPRSLHISLSSCCVAVVLVSPPTFLSLKSPTIVFPVVLRPPCSGMYVGAFSSSLNISTHVLFSPSLPLPFSCLYFSFSPSQSLPFFCLPCLLEAGMQDSSV